MAKKKPKPRGRDNGSMVLPVAYSNVSIGDKTCRVGITISRGNLTIAAADRYFCDKRLEGHILARAGGAQAAQESLPGAEEADFELDGVFDVKGYGVNAKWITCGLTFAKESVDVETLANFAKREGMFTIGDTADLPPAERGKKPDVDESEAE